MSPSMMKAKIAQQQKEIELLTVTKEAFHEHGLRLREEIERLIAEKQALVAKVVELDLAAVRLTAERDDLKSTCERAKGCILGLLHRTPVRDVAETLAEIDAAIAKEKT